MKSVSLLKSYSSVYGSVRDFGPISLGTICHDKSDAVWVNTVAISSNRQHFIVNVLENKKEKWTLIFHACTMQYKTNIVDSASIHAIYTR